MKPLPISNTHIIVVGSIMSEIKHTALVENCDVRLCSFSELVWTFGTAVVRGLGLLDTAT
jgi:hypothetical protein